MKQTTIFLLIGFPKHSTAINGISSASLQLQTTYLELLNFNLIKAVYEYSELTHIQLHMYRLPSFNK